MRNLTLYQIEAALEKLGGEEGVHRFLKGELVLVERDIVNANDVSPELDTLCKVTIGKLKSADNALAELNSEKVFPKKPTQEVIKLVPFSKEEVSLDLVCLSVLDLGFTQRVTTDDVLRRAEELGLELCPAEVGIQLRLDWWSLPKDFIKVAMKPIGNGKGEHFLFSLSSSRRQKSISAANAYSEKGWGHAMHFIFVKPR